MYELYKLIPDYSKKERHERTFESEHENIII